MSKVITMLFTDNLIKNKARMANSENTDVFLVQKSKRAQCQILPI